MTHELKRYYKAEAYLTSLTHNPGLDQRGAKVDPSIYIKRMRYFWEFLGKPGQNLKFVHITGTAGKGTVATMVQSGLIKAGHKTGLFSSPDIQVMTEKIKVDDLYIAPNELADLVDELKPQIERANQQSNLGSLTYFEVFVAMALTYFERHNVEYAVLEVGLGGRYDATNVIEHPLIAAITNIDYDHTDVLGKTLRQIALDKAGIIKPGSHFVTTETRASLLSLFHEVYATVDATFEEVADQNMQTQNTSLARAILGHLHIESPKIDDIQLPGRFEIVQKDPLVILDGSHNPRKMRSVVQNISKHKYHKLHLLLSIAANKDVEEIIKEIVPHADHITITTFKTVDRVSAEAKPMLRLAKHYARPGVVVDFEPDNRQALDRLLKTAGKNDAVLITGSFFLIGALRNHWYSRERVLLKRTSF